MIRTLLFTSLLTALAAAASPELLPGQALPPFPGQSRDYAATTKNDYAKADFRAEVAVTVKSGHGGHGSAFFGLGKGAANPANYHEPTSAPSLVFRLCPNDFGGGQVNAVINGEAIGEALTLGDGTHRLRLSWEAKRQQAWLEVHPNWKAGDTFTPKLLLPISAKGVDFAKDGRLFVGGAGGASFNDFQAGPLTAAEFAKLPVYDSFPKDLSAHTWLPIDKASALPAGDASTAPVDSFLKDLRASLRPLLCQYQGASLAASRALPGGQLELPHSKWQSSLTCSPVAGEPDARDLSLTLTLQEGQALSVGLAAAFDFTEWSAANYVMIPGSVYDGNRHRVVPGGYNGGLPASDRKRQDLPITINDIQRLELSPEAPSKLEVNSCDVTTPAICAFDKKAKRGFIVLAEQGGRDAKGDFLRKAHSEIIDNAFAVEESAERSRATLVVSAPGVRSRKPEFVGFSDSPDRGLNLSQGQSITLKLRLYSFAAADIPALLRRFCAVRKALTGPNQPRLLLPASQISSWMNNQIDASFLDQPQAKFYRPENGDWIAFGWIGGWMNTFPMLAAGDAKRLERVTQTFDFGFQAQAASGYFHYAIRNDGNVSFRDPAPGANLARCEGDILFWMLKQFELLKAQGRAEAIKPEWETGMKRLADAIVSTWKRHGQWGKMVEIETGEVAEFNTSGGVTMIGGLVLASHYFREPRYLEVAKEAARFYFDRDVAAQGFTSGACGDILHHAESETSYAFLHSLVCLYDATGDQEWLDKAQTAHALFSSWITSHDYELPKNTELGALGAKLTGAFWASTQNKHGAPGICTASGDALLRLARASDSTAPAELLRDIVRAHAENIRDGGAINERLTYCDADSRGHRGTWTTGWCMTNGAMMAVEIPGIYLRTDSERLVVFDAVEVKVLSRSAAMVKLEISNPTQFDAQISVFAENAEQAKKPLGNLPFLKWPKLAVKAGETRTLTISPTP